MFSTRRMLRSFAVLALSLGVCMGAFLAPADAATTWAQGRFLDASGGVINSLGVLPDQTYDVQFQVRSTSGSNTFNGYNVAFVPDSAALSCTGWNNYLGGSKYEQFEGSWAVFNAPTRSIGSSWLTLGRLSIEHDGSTNQPITLGWDSTWTSLSLTTYQGLPINSGAPLTVVTGPGYTPPGNDVAVASPEGDSGNVGGVDFLFDNVTTGGTVSAEHRYQTDAGLYPLAMSDYNFVVSGNPSEWWEIEFDGAHTGKVELTFCYRDENITGREQDLQVLHQLSDNSWEALTKLGQDMAANTITVETWSFSPFVMGYAVPEPASLTALLAVAGLGALRRRRR